MSIEKEPQVAQEETPKKSHWKPWVRAVALLLAVIMVLDIWLSGMIRVRESDETYLGEFLELAKSTTDASTSYLTESDFKRAWRVLRHTIGKPDSYEDYDTFASVAIAQGDYETAAGYLQGCIDTCTGSSAELAQLYLRLGSLQMLSGESFYPAAKESFTSAIALDDTLANAWLLRAQLSLDAGDTEAAVADVTAYKALADDPEILGAVAPLYEAVGDYETAVECYTAALENPNGYDVSLLQSRGYCYIQLQDTEKAMADFNRFFGEGGVNTDGTVWMLLSLCRLEMGLYTQALDAFDGAVKRGCEVYEYYAQMIPCAFSYGEYDRVVTYADAALSAPEGTYSATELAAWHKWKGLGLLAQDTYTEALTELEASLAMDDTAQDIYYYAGFAALHTEDYETAVDYFTASIAREEQTDACTYYRGLCLVNMTEYEKAREDFLWVAENSTDAESVAGAQEMLAAFEEDAKTNP